MDKILQSMGSRDGGISVTNDGATILRAIHVDNAAAKVLVNIAKTQASASARQTRFVVPPLAALIAVDRIWCFRRCRIPGYRYFSDGFNLCIQIPKYILYILCESIYSVTCAPFLRYMHPICRLASVWKCSAAMWYAEAIVIVHLFRPSAFLRFFTSVQITLCISCRVTFSLPYRVPLLQN